MAPPRQFASVFFIGFLALALALAFGSISGHFLDLHPSLVALRYFGLGWMAAGMALWIALRRHEAGKPGVNLLLLFLVGASMTVSVVGLLLPFAAFGPILTWGLIGFALSAAALRSEEHTSELQSPTKLVCH